MPVDVSAGNNVIDIHAISDPNGLFERALGTFTVLLFEFSVPQRNGFFLLLARLLLADSTLEIGKMDPLKMYTGTEILDLQILTTQAEGHSALAPAERPDKENLKKPNVDSHGQGYQATGAKKHPALDTNQFRGVNPDGHQPSSPEDMTPDEINQASSKLELTPGQELTKRLGNEPAPSPVSTPTPRPV